MYLCTKAADDSSKQRARVLSAMVLTYFTRNIPKPEMIHIFYALQVRFHTSSYTTEQAPL